MRLYSLDSQGSFIRIVKLSIMDSGDSGIFEKCRISDRMLVYYQHPRRRGTIIIINVDQPSGGLTVFTVQP